MKIFTLFLFACLLQFRLQATVWPVAVTSNQFAPANMNVFVGDTIQFNFQAGFHNAISAVVGAASGVVPAGAADINSGAPSGTNPRTYQYKVTVAGNYRYYCQVHSADGIAGMSGLFTASAPLVQATVWPVAVTSNQFTPANMNVFVGDTIQFNFQVGFHNAVSGVVGSASGVVPAGAADINSGAPSGTTPRVYKYKVTIAGNYRYYCQVHSTNGTTGMVGFFTASAPLPANLKNFAARFNQGTVLLNWQTVTESNVAYFAINKSYNGRDFTEVTRVPAAGNSTTLLSYNFTDRSITPENTYIYYSLSTVDRDGKTSLSPMVLVRNTQAVKKLITSLSPNPITQPGHLMLQFNADAVSKLKVSVYDASGKKVLEDEMNAVAGLNNGHLHMGDMPPGVYNLVFSLGKLKETHRVVVK